VPAAWTYGVNQPQNAAEVEAVRRCVTRGRPFGSDAWLARVARDLGLEVTLRPRGRPKNKKKVPVTFSASKAKGTVKPSDMPITMSRTVSEDVKCFSICGVWGMAES